MWPGNVIQCWAWFACSTHAARVESQVQATQTERAGLGDGWDTKGKSELSQGERGIEGEKAK